MNCPHCKSFVSDGSLVCAKCGKSLLRSESSKQSNSREKSHHTSHRHHHSSERGHSHHSSERSEFKSSGNSTSSLKRHHTHRHKSSSKHHHSLGASTTQQMTIVALVLFFPIGVFAYLKSRKMYKLIMRGKREQAYALVDIIEKLNVFAILVGILFWLFIFMIAFA